MSTIEESIDVEVPVSAASEQWTEFASFPNDAEVTFLELDEQSTRVIVQMPYEPHRLDEALDREIASSITDELESFKHFIEQRAA